MNSNEPWDALIVYIFRMSVCNSIQSSDQVKEKQPWLGIHVEKCFVTFRLDITSFQPEYTIYFFLKNPYKRLESLDFTVLSRMDPYNTDHIE